MAPDSIQMSGWCDGSMSDLESGKLLFTYCCKMTLFTKAVMPCFVWTP